MDITAEVLDEIALCADRNKDVRLMLLAQLLQEIRDVKNLLQKSDNACYSRNYRSDDADYGNN